MGIWGVWEMPVCKICSDNFSCLSDKCSLILLVNCSQKKKKKICVVLKKIQGVCVISEMNIVVGCFSQWFSGWFLQGLVSVFPLKHPEGSGSQTRGESWSALGAAGLPLFFCAGTRFYILVQSSRKPPDKKRNIKAKKSLEMVVKQLSLPNVYRVSVRALTE